jgi:hypothetical protein
MIKNTRDTNEALENEIAELIKQNESIVNSRKQVFNNEQRQNYIRAEHENEIAEHLLDESNTISSDEVVHEPQEPVVNKLNTNVVDNQKEDSFNEKEFAEVGHFENKGAKAPESVKPTIRTSSDKFKSQEEAVKVVQKILDEDKDFGVSKKAGQDLPFDSLKALRNPNVRKQLKAQMKKKQMGVINTAILNDNPLSWLGKGLVGVVVKPVGMVVSKLRSSDFHSLRSAFSSGSSLSGFKNIFRKLFPVLLIGSACLYGYNHHKAHQDYTLADQQKMAHTFLREAYLQDQRMGGIAGIPNPGLSVDERVKMNYDAAYFKLQHPNQALPDSLNVDIQDNTTGNATKPFNRDAAISFIQQASTFDQTHLHSQTLAASNDLSQLSDAQLKDKVSDTVTSVSKDSDREATVALLDRSDNAWEQAHDTMQQPETKDGMDPHMAAFQGLLKAYSPQDDVNGANPDRFKMVDGKQQKLIHDLGQAIAPVLPKDMTPFNQPSLISPEKNAISKAELDKIRKTLYGNSYTGPDMNNNSTDTVTKKTLSTKSSSSSVNNSSSSSDSSNTDTLNNDGNGANVSVGNNPMSQTSTAKTLKPSF